MIMRTLGYNPGQQQDNTYLLRSLFLPGANVASGNLQTLYAS
jgi:hypothetical protein